MKNNPWILIAGGLLCLAFAPGACGGSGGNTTAVTTTAGTGGGGTHTTTTSTGSHTTSSSSSGATTGTGGGTIGCDMVTGDPNCDPCIQSSCCSQATACENDADCSGCLDGSGDPTACSTNTLLMALQMCISGSCKDPCTPKSACNPVTNQGCMNGDACDFDAGNTMTFQCFSGTNTAMACAACDNMNGPFCAPGFRCNDDSSNMNGQCSHYCCTDADCGTGGKCNTMLAAGIALPGGVGVCDGMADGGTTVASCMPPATPPSGGSCFTM